MATTNATFVLYDKAIGKICDGSIDLDAASALGVILLTSAYTPDAALHDFVDDVAANEVSTTNTGYARFTLLSPTWTETAAGVWTYDSADPSWTAGTANLTAHYFVLYHTIPATNATRQLVGYGLLDNTPASVTTTNTNVLKYVVPASGWFNFTKV